MSVVSFRDVIFDPTTALLTAILTRRNDRWEPQKLDRVGVALVETKTQIEAFGTSVYYTVGSWKVTVLISKKYPQRALCLVYMDKKGQLLGSSSPLNLDDAAGTNGESSSTPHSLDSFVTVSDEGEDSYTIIDHSNSALLQQSEDGQGEESNSTGHDQVESSSLISNNWDMVKSVIQDPAACYSSSSSSSSVSPQNISDESDNDEQEPPSPSPNDARLVSNFELPDFETESHASKILAQVPDSTENELEISAKPPVHYYSQRLGGGGAAAAAVTGQDPTMSQSVMMKDDYISQSKARSLQKHNKDLLVKLNKVSDRLTEAKQLIGEQEHQLKLKDEENATLVRGVCDLEDSIVELKKEKAQVQKRLETLQNSLQAKDKSAASLTEEIDYLSNENRKIKSTLTDNEAELKTLRNELAVLKVAAGTRETSKGSSSQHRRSEHSKRPSDDVMVTRLPTRGHTHSTHSSRDHKREGRRDQRVAPPVFKSDQPQAAVRGSSSAFESLKKSSALAKCPICGEERPAEKAMDMTHHVEDCLRRRGYT